MKRYDQCDSTCTADCGHCKGAGKPQLRKGQKVRITYEAIYDGEPGDSRGWLVGVDGEKRFRFDAPRYATIEPIEDVMPGDIYRDADGQVVARLDRATDYVWRSLSDDRCVTDRGVTRPLTLLVRDGKPVTP